MESENLIIGLLYSPNNTIFENRSIKKMVNKFHYDQANNHRGLKDAIESSKIILKDNIYKYEFNLISN